MKNVYIMVQHYLTIMASVQCVNLRYTLSPVGHLLQHSLVLRLPLTLEGSSSQPHTCHPAR